MKKIDYTKIFFIHYFSHNSDITNKKISVEKFCKIFHVSPYTVIKSQNMDYDTRQKTISGECKDCKKVTFIDFKKQKPEILKIEKISRYEYEIDGKKKILTITLDHPILLKFYNLECEYCGKKFLLCHENEFYSIEELKLKISSQEQNLKTTYKSLQDEIEALKIQLKNSQMEKQKLCEELNEIKQLNKNNSSNLAIELSEKNKSYKKLSDKYLTLKSENKELKRENELSKSDELLQKYLQLEAKNMELENDKSRLTNNVNKLIQGIKKLKEDKKK